MSDGGWVEWREYVITELKRLGTCSGEIKKSVDTLNKLTSRVQIDIATLKVKAGVWGLMGGMIPVIMAVCLWFLTKNI